MMLRKTNLFNCSRICLEMLFARIYGSVNWLKTLLGDLLTFRFQTVYINFTLRLFRDNKANIYLADRIANGLICDLW